MPEAAAGPGHYAAATETLRSTAKWLLAAFAGVGGVLVAGLQLTSLGSLGWHDPLRLLAAVLGVGGAMGAVGYMVRDTAAILTAEWVTLAHFDDDAFDAMVQSGRSVVRKDELEAIGASIDDVQEELYGHVARSIDELQRRLREANEKTSAMTGGAQATPEEWAQAFAGAGELRAAAREVVDYANYERTARSFARLKRRLARGAVCAVISVTVFAYASNPPKEDKPLKVEVSGQSP